MRHPLLAALLLTTATACTSIDAADSSSAGMGDASAGLTTTNAMEAVVAGPARTAANRERDRYRNPGSTLLFFGVQPDDTVVEISPGAGWYTEILAPYLAAEGRYYAAASERGLGGVNRLKAANPALYGNVQTTIFPVPAGQTVQPQGQADVVLTFRNVHNWMLANPPIADQVFAQAYQMLKPGGVLGVVEHRLPENADPAREARSGYVKTSTVRRLAQAAGFRFAGASEINANPRDTKDYPEGVWTLPPTYRLGDADRARYAAIGESDRMTLKFVKPR